VRRLDPKECAVLVIDVQERLSAAMPEARMQDLVRAVRILAEAAPLLGGRVIVTEQYPNGLGPTIGPVKDALSGAGAPFISKMDFSACGESKFGEAWAAAPPKTAIVLGMETHVCVFQTVRDLVGQGVTVHVPVDGVVSRRDDHREIGLALCKEAGATLTTTETVVFDWLVRAGGDAFKRISKLVR
jgi:nicotinamidase-related amidase